MNIHGYINMLYVHLDHDSHQRHQWVYNTLQMPFDHSNSFFHHSNNFLLSDAKKQIGPNQLLRFGIFLILLQKPRNTPVDTLLKRPQRFIPQHLLGLADVVVSCHGRHHSPQLCESRRLANDAKEDLAQRAEDNTPAL